MARLTILNSTLQDIADAIRTKLNTQDTYKPGQMKNAILSIPSGDNTYAFIIVSYPTGETCTASNGTDTLYAIGTSGYFVFSIPAPVSTPETWTVYSNNGSTTLQASVTISSKGESHSVILSHDNIAALKADMALTEYCMLSNAIGDGASENGRYFTRDSSDPPAIFIDHYYTTGYNGYGVITINASGISYTNSSYGNLIYRNSYTTVSGTTYHYWCMDGCWQYYFPTYTIDGNTISRGNRSSFAYFNENGMQGQEQYKTELESFIDRLGALTI